MSECELDPLLVKCGNRKVCVAIELNGNAAINLNIGTINLNDFKK